MVSDCTKLLVLVDLFRCAALWVTEGRVYTVEVVVVWVVSHGKESLYDRCNLIWQNGRLVFESLAGDVKGTRPAREVYTT